MGRLRAWALFAGVAACSGEPTFGDGVATTTGSTGATSHAMSASSGGGDTVAAGTGGDAQGSGGDGGAATGDGGGDPSTGGSGGGGEDPCAAIHVSLQGDDGATGCADDPLRTVGAGIALGAEDGLEVRICGGTYLEDVEMLDGVHLRGNFDCASWTAGASVTTLLGSGATVATLTFAGAGDSEVEDLTVQAADQENGGRSTGIMIQSGSPILRRLDALGGAGSVSAGTGSVAIAIAGGAPVLESVFAEGGSGSSPSTYGSTAVEITGGTPTLRDSTLRGGTGQGVSGSVALRLIDVSLDEEALQRLELDGGEGTSLAGDARAVTIGLDATDSVATLQGSTVDGGEGTMVPSRLPCVDRGTMVQAAIGATRSTLELRGVRAWGGVIDLVSPPAYIHAGVIGVDSAITISDSAIASGFATATDGCSTTGLGFWGISGRVRVSSSTLVATGVDAVAVQIDAAEQVSLEDDLLIAFAEGGTGVGLLWAPPTCDAGRLALTSLQRNAFGGNGDVAFAGCEAPHEHPHLPSLFADIACDAPDAVVAGNVEVTDDCDAESAECFPVAGCAQEIQACADGLFDAWDLADHGRSAVFGDALALLRGAPCAIVEGRGACSGLDAVGDDRTDPCSIGARESDASCAGPGAGNADQMPGCGL